jgi:ketosteroid isomerase-like protein
MTTSTETISPSQLPELVSSYLVAHQARDLDTAVGYYTDDATVIDEGNVYQGPDEIRAWLSTAASEFTYTIELTGAQRIDDQHYVAIHHLEGNFPGGVVDLHFTFTLRDGRISKLTIEPPAA